jgi:hypothetical protein
MATNIWRKNLMLLVVVDATVDKLQLILFIEQQQEQ